MKKTFIFLGCLILSASLFAQQPLVRLYMDDGGIREFDLDDIEEITHISRSHDMIMEVFQHDGVEDVYPAMSVSKLSFTTDSLDTRMFTAHIFDQPRHFAVSSIDSIVFSRLEPKVVDNITVVDSLSWADIISVDENTITLRAGSSLASAITTGWFVVCAPIPEAPDGFLRKVTGLSTQGDQLIATTEDGDLFDVIEEGMICFQVTYSEEEMTRIINEARGIKNTSPEKSITFKYDHEIYKGLKIGGELAVSNTFSYSFVKWKHLIRQYSMQHSFEMVYKISAEASVEYDIIKEKISINELLGISPFRLPYQVVWIGLVPVVVTSYVDLQAGVNLSIHDKITTSLTHTTNTRVGMEYDMFQGVPWTKISSSRSEPTFLPPTLSLGGKFKVYSGPQVNQGFYGMHKLFNAYAGVFVFGELELDFLEKPLWKLYAGVETGAGIESSWLELEKDFPYSIEVKRLLRQASDLIEKVVPDKAAIGDTIRIFGQGFGSIEKSFVGFKIGPSLLEEDVVTVNKYIKWRENEIEFVLPPGFPSPPGQGEVNVDVLVNSKGFWTDNVPFTVLIGPTIESVVPDTARIGKLLVIKGKRFGDTRKTSEVSFDGILVEEYEAWSDTEITVKVPEGIDDGMLTVEVEERISNEVPYVVAVPFIANIHPNEVFPGDEMVITGKYFDDLQNESFVSFNGVVAANYLTWSDKQIVLKVPDKIESGLLWVQVAGKNSNEKAYVVKEIEVSIMPPRIVIYEMMEGATEVEHPFEAYAKPDSVYRFTWQFDDGNSYSEVVQKGETSKVSHTYVDVKDGDTFYPSVELYDLEGKLLAMDDISILITTGPDEITIGNVVWMTRNLDVDAGNNWYPTYRYTINDSVVSFTHKEYGRLYDWGTALNACPAGWQLPSKKNWDDLINYLGGVMVAGGKLKSKVTIEAGNPHNHPGWYAPNVDATNQIGFSALPGGSYTGDGLFGIGSFLGIGRFGMWWLADEYTWSDPEKNAWVYVISNNFGNVTRSNADKRYGHSIRCVKIVD